MSENLEENEKIEIESKTLDQFQKGIHIHVQ